MVFKTLLCSFILKPHFFNELKNSDCFLILSLSTKLFVDVIGEIEGEKMGINYGFNKLRFVNPVKSNDMIRGVFKLKEVTRRNPNEILFTHDLTIEIKDVKKPAIVCEWLNLSIF